MTPIEAGSKVEIIRHGETAKLLGTVLFVITAGPSVAYKVAWWAGRQRMVDVLDAVEVRPARDA